MAAKGPRENITLELSTVNSVKNVQHIKKLNSLRLF